MPESTPYWVLWEERVAAGAHWSHLLRRGTTMRIMDVSGGANVSMLRGARIVFAHEIRRHTANGELVCHATAEVACMDAERGGPRRLPSELLSEWER